MVGFGFGCGERMGKETERVEVGGEGRGVGSWQCAVLACLTCRCPGTAVFLRPVGTIRPGRRPARWAGPIGQTASKAIAVPRRGSEARRPVCRDGPAAGCRDSPVAQGEVCQCITGTVGPSADSAAAGRPPSATEPAEVECALSLRRKHGRLPWGCHSKKDRFPLGLCQSTHSSCFSCQGAARCRKEAVHQASSSQATIANQKVAKHVEINASATPKRDSDYPRPHSNIPS